MRLLQSMGCLAPVAALLYGVVGLLILGQFGGQALNFLASMNWEQVEGTVVSSSIEDEWDTTGERYIGRLLYTYEVAGVAYEGTQLNLQGQIYLGNQDDAEQLLAPYPVGASVMPYVNPNDPTQAVLDRSLPNASWVLLGIGAGLVLLSIAVGLRVAFSKRGDKNDMAT